MTWSNASCRPFCWAAATVCARVDEFEAKHVNETVAQLRARSTAISDALDSGSLAIAGVTYHLADGRTVLRDHLGDIGEGP